MVKNKYVLLVLFSLLILFCAGCIESSFVDSKSTTNIVSGENYDVAVANNAFAFDMYSNVKDTNDGNIFFSPNSMFTAMAICYDGAEGTTQEEIANVFYFPLDKTILQISLRDMNSEINSETDDYELETANALWIQEDFPIKDQYISNVEEFYSGKATNLDFVVHPDESKETINDWVEEKTNDKIKDLIPDDLIDEYTRLIITNAIYFNGKWLSEFDKEATREEKFYLSENEEIYVETMYSSMYLNYAENSNSKIIELPYKGNDICMYIVLPNENAIEEFETSFSLDDYAALKSSMDSRSEVRVWLPKFKFETKTELSESLKIMGIVDAFEHESADFSGISDRKLAISAVIHQAFVDVQEEGTEAAAATAIEISEEEGFPVKEFRADHPFMFFIEDKRTSCILFMGKVENPEYE